ncbi:hypothetical protein SSPO_100670 [Streptomyces antimycoticus]|uniref:Uncharacterized protein n=1 Tax=Streptomyces antimycoticus TaxID=68175 RepID=A0A499VEI5_9ACTN|nr:hypothetical protein [Streptomyces antimycoticus]BBJ47349.1 hypothetical protein SSPO_100670 [Streptomyces antimycoticus]
MLERVGKDGADRIVGSAQTHRTREGVLGHVGPDLVIEAEHGAGPADQALTVRGEAEAPPAADEQRAVEGRLEPGDLLADRSLCHMQGMSRSGHAGPLCRDDEGPEQCEVEVTRRPYIIFCNGPHVKHSLY